MSDNGHATGRGGELPVPPTPRASAAHPSRGFGLIEMVVAISLMTVVVLMVFLTFFRARNELGRIGTLVNSRQEARATIQLIERDVRMAGSNFAKMPINASNNGTAITLSAINPGPGAGDCDSIQLVGAWSATAKTTAAATQTNDIIVQSLPLAPNNFAVNDLILLTNGTVGHLFQITAINNGTKAITHATTSPWNVVPTAWNWPGGTGGVYASGAQVYKIDILTYSVDSTNYRRPALVRRPFNGVPQVVSYDVNKFQLWYRMQDSTLTRTPPVTGQNTALIDKVRPTVFTSLKDPTRPAYNDSVWSEVRPRTF